MPFHNFRAMMRPGPQDPAGVDWAEMARRGGDQMARQQQLQQQAAAEAQRVWPQGAPTGRLSMQAVMPTPGQPLMPTGSPQPAGPQPPQPPGYPTMDEFRRLAPPPPRPQLPQRPQQEGVQVIPQLLAALGDVAGAYGGVPDQDNLGKVMGMQHAQRDQSYQDALARAALQHEDATRGWNWRLQQLQMRQGQEAQEAARGMQERQFGLQERGMKLREGEFDITRRMAERTLGEQAGVGQNLPAMIQLDVDATKGMPPEEQQKYFDQRRAQIMQGVQAGQIQPEQARAMLEGVEQAKQGALYAQYASRPEMRPGVPMPTAGEVVGMGVRAPLRTILGPEAEQMLMGKPEGMSADALDAAMRNPYVRGIAATSPFHTLRRMLGLPGP